MAVFTEVPFDLASALIDRLDIGRLTSLEGCSGGIENTNYFADTTQGRYVLTLFERLGFAELPFYLHLMKHLAARGIPVPGPKADSDGEILHRVLDKPAAVVDRLHGSHHLAPDVAHTASVGRILARMHLAGADFVLQQPNLRGLGWWLDTAPLVANHLTAGQRELLDNELLFQQQVAASAPYAALPRGPIHGDLFRDNAMFDDAGADEVSGVFDFYFAGVDCFIYDIAICLDDWCVDLDSGRLIEDRAQALVDAYDAVRPLSGDEARLLAAMQRAAALRFWISRLWDWHLPRDASLLAPHDPNHFERVLRHAVEAPWHHQRAAASR